MIDLFMVNWSRTLPFWISSLQSTLLTIFGLIVLSFTLTYGMWYLGCAMDAIFGYAFGQRDWEWDNE